MADEMDNLIFEVVAHVTRPLLKLDTEPRYLRFDSVFYAAEENKKARQAAEGTAIMAAPTLADVYDVQRKIDAQVIVNEVLKTEMEKKYPDGAYKGRIFRIVKKKVEGRRYFNFEIQEVRLKVEEPAKPAPAAHVPAKK